jgi:predicted PP-loop superfamily ATPase
MQNSQIDNPRANLAAEQRYDTEAAACGFAKLGVKVKFASAAKLCPHLRKAACGVAHKYDTQ